MSAEGEICAAAEDERMWMGCRFEGKKVENGTIVDIGDVQHHYEMGRTCFYLSDELALACSVNGLLVGSIELRRRNDLTFS